jgi:prolyl-tRNA synthetase
MHIESGMKLSEYTRETLERDVETAKNKGEYAFQLALCPIFPNMFDKVNLVSEQLYKELAQANYRVLLDDRNQKPRNMFQVIAFLGIPHRIVISGRSLEAGVVEYLNLQTNEHQKIDVNGVKTFFDTIMYQ